MVRVCSIDEAACRPVYLSAVRTCISMVRHVVGLGDLSLMADVESACIIALHCIATRRQFWQQLVEFRNTH